MSDRETKECLRDATSHFGFGENWESFASTITTKTLSRAKESLAKLLSGDELKDVSFLDIGCGAGLSMLAARELGASRVSGIDIDRDSVRTAELVLTTHLPGGGWTVRELSVFDLDPEQTGLYDVVHSWGVLHHTGDMWPAIEKATTFVAPGGLLVLALYRKTPLCGFWTREKRRYTRASDPERALVRLIYKTLYAAGLIATGRDPLAYIRNYGSVRGMDWHHDVHDWLGGYPYESVLPQEVKEFVDRLGFSIVRTLKSRRRHEGCSAPTATNLF